MDNGKFEDGGLHVSEVLVERGEKGGGLCIPVGGMMPIDVSKSVEVDESIEGCATQSTEMEEDHSLPMSGTISFQFFYVDRFSTSSTGQKSTY